MNWNEVLTALLPENVLLLGMLALLCGEIVTGRPRDGFFLALCAVLGAGAGAPGPARVGLLRRAVRRPLLGRSRHVGCEARAARAHGPGAPDLARRFRGDAVLRAAAGFTLRGLPARVRGQHANPVPRHRTAVAAGVRAGAARQPAPRQRRGGAQVPGAGRRRDGDVPHGRRVAVWPGRLDGDSDVRRCAARRPTRSRSAVSC